VELHRHHIHHYDYTEEAIAGDEFAGIAERLLHYDVIVFATPVYWYAMSGRMKVFFDRLNELTSRAKAVGKALKGKTTYLIASGAAPALPDGFEVPFRETSEYFGMRFAGTLYRQVA
jgi:multimeric flavodoxin WrbA